MNTSIHFPDISSQQACSRTFYIGKNDEVRVFGVTGGRLNDGRLNGGSFVAAGHSRIGAVAWVDGNTPHIRYDSRLVKNQSFKIKFH